MKEDVEVKSLLHCVGVEWKEGRVDGYTESGWSTPTNTFAFDKAIRRLHWKGNVENVYVKGIQRNQFDKNYV